MQQILSQFVLWIEGSKREPKQRRRRDEKAQRVVPLSQRTHMTKK